MKRYLPFIFITLLSIALFSVEFDNLNGSDLMLGVGARQISLGGAGTSLVNSPACIYWNSAGLAEIKNTELQIDLESPTQVNDILILLHDPNLNLGKIPVKFGVGVINRLRFKGRSDTVWDGYAAHLLDLTMIDVDNFIGEIDSRTYDLRFSTAAEITNKLQFGFTFLHLD